MIQRPRKRPGTALAVDRLEDRRLLTATTPTGIWLGQDGHDLVGPSSTVGPSDVQDIHIALADLPSKTITHATIVGYGGGEWDYQGNYGPWPPRLSVPARTARPTSTWNRIRPRPAGRFRST